MMKEVNTKENEDTINHNYIRENFLESSNTDCMNCKNKMKTTNWIVFGIGIAAAIGILAWIFIDLRKKNYYKSKFYNFQKTLN